MITGRQIREARKLLGWKPADLAWRTKLTAATLSRAESVESEPPITIAKLATIQAVFEAAGVEFISGNGSGAGVRLRKAKPE